MSAETRRMAEARRLMGQHGYRHDAVILAVLERAEEAERERDVEREYGDAARESNDRLMDKVARIEALAEHWACLGAEWATSVAAEIRATLKED